MQLQLKQINVQPGQRVLLHDISWNNFEQILEELGEDRASRLTYYKGMLEIMVPLPEHESAKENIGDFVKALLEELDIEFWPLGSTTFKRQLRDSGLEPDECFYIQNEATVRGKDRIDLTADPPPDLAIEIDVTSSSEIKKRAYEALGVPELWIYTRTMLKILVLGKGGYVESATSPTFPNFPAQEMIPYFDGLMKGAGRNAAMKAFRAWVRENLLT